METLEPRTSRSTPTSSKRKPTTLPPETVEYLKAWMMSPEHIAHPYPTEQEKAQIMEETGIELKQLTNWFVNNRKRYWKPRVEAQLQEQAKSGVLLPAMTKSASTTTLSSVSSRPLTSPARAVSEVSSDASTEGSLSDDETTETVHVHVLRDAESLEDVTLLSEPEANIEKTYTFTIAHDGSKSRRETELVRIRKEALRRHMRKRSVSSIEESTPRKKYRRVSFDLWREACQAAPAAYHESLPSLEEAAELFGFAT